MSLALTLTLIICAPALVIIGWVYLDRLCDERADADHPAVQRMYTRRITVAVAAYLTYIAATFGAAGAPVPLAILGTLALALLVGVAADRRIEVAARARSRRLI